MALSAIGDQHVLGGMVGKPMLVVLLRVLDVVVLLSTPSILGPVLIVQACFILLCSKT
jgi:hypothetical protein